MLKPDRSLFVPLAVVLAVLGATTFAMAQGGADRAVATLNDAGGDDVGRVTFTQKGDSVAVTVRASGLKPGFHGFHVHENGVCSAPSSEGGETGAFLSAGGHFARGAQVHGNHAGDMPPLFVRDDGTARASFVIDSFKVGQLTSGDGSAVMVHEGPDNSANIEKRYKSRDSKRRGPDKETLDTGDSGDRSSCGVLVAR